MSDASDDFNRADNTTLGSNWITDELGGWSIVSNTAQDTNSAEADSIVAWNATFANDHFSQATIVLKKAPAVNVRVSSADVRATRSTYFAQAGSINCYIEKIVSGSATLLYNGPNFTVVSVGDVFRCEVAGTTLRMFKNGTQIGVDTTDASLTSGAPGMMGNNFAGVFDAFDDWSGGPLASISVTGPFPTFRPDLP